MHMVVYDAPVRPRVGRERTPARGARGQRRRSMKLGLFMMPIHNHKRDYHTTLMEDIEAIVHADSLGFSEAWVGEHYSSKSEQITSPLLFLAHLLAADHADRRRHRRDLPAAVPPGGHGRADRHVRPPGEGPLHRGPRPRRAAARLRGLRRDGRGPQLDDDRGHRHHGRYLDLRSALRVQRQALADIPQGLGLRGYRARLYGQALSGSPIRRSRSRR